MTIGAKNLKSAWHVVVLAGQRPGIDPLAAHFGAEWKALVPISGAPMLSHVLSALLNAPEVSKVTIVAQQPDAFHAAVPADARISWFASGAGISTSILSLLDQNDAPEWPILVTTADHPLLTTEMVASFIAGCDDCDLAVAMVERAVLLGAYPENKRTWFKFHDGWWSGANIFALKSPKSRAALQLWAKAEQDRKQVWKLFLHFGPLLALRAITRSIGMADALRVAGRRLGLVAKLVPLPHAEAAIDVDKPADHVLASDILSRRAL